MLALLAAAHGPLLLLADAHDLQHFVLVQVFEPGRSNDLLVVFLGEEEAGVLQPLAVEVISVLEDLADCVDRDVLSENILALALHRLDVVAISQAEEVIDVLAFDLDVV